MGQLDIATRWNLNAIEEAYERLRSDPESVDPSWRWFFEGFELGGAHWKDQGPRTKDEALGPSSFVLRPSQQTGIVRLIDAYRDLGHFLAHLDPLSEPRTSHPLLELSEFGFDEADLDRTFDTSHFVGLPQATLRELLAALRETYCRTIGVEYMHIQDTRIRRWLQERMEPRRNRPGFDRDQKLRILKELHYAELFEQFLHTRYVGQKRFSLEGAETLIPVLEAIVEKAAEQRRARDRHGHGPPRPAQRAGQHPAQALPGDLRRVRGQLPARVDRRRRRRQVPPRLLQRPRHGRAASRSTCR